MVPVANLCPPGSSEERQGGPVSLACFHLGPALDGCKVNFSKGVMSPHCRDVFVFYFGGGQQ